MEEKIIDKALLRAEQWLNEADSFIESQECRFQDKIKTMLEHPEDKLLFMELLDQSFRASKPERAVDQLQYLLRRNDNASFLSFLEKMEISALKLFGQFAPKLAVSETIRHIRNATGDVVIHGETEPFSAFLQQRHSEGIQSNINFIGEAVLGEQEAERRMQKYIKALKDPDITYISVKISTIFSQIDSLAFEWTLDNLVARLSKLYRIAKENGGKMVNLDMEEYRDVELTATAFMRTLEQPEFIHYRAGIVLQAYLPEGALWQQRLSEWALERVAGGGVPIKVRIVKGANMEMEMTEASTEGWENVTYDTKLETDANFKQMIDYAFDAKRMKAVTIGIATHNLFDMAYAYELAIERGFEKDIVFEMLEGIATASRRVLQKEGSGLLLYAPVASKEEFINAIAYLVRRLDENTTEENFLRHAFGLQTGSDAWNLLKDEFIRSYRAIPALQNTPKRTQNRLEKALEVTSSYESGTFVNESSTDWSLPQNREWACQIVKSWDFTQHTPMQIPVIVGGEPLFYDRQVVTAHDHSRYQENIKIAQFALADENDVNRAINVAATDPDEWGNLPMSTRHEILCNVAKEIRTARADLIGIAAAETGKLFKECDIEVSEAIDFAEFYPLSAAKIEALETVDCTPKGVGVVITPWNFPVAIPAGGILAALSAGNRVIFKPATAAVATAYRLCECFWNAGVSRNTLQFLPCRADKTGGRLAAHEDVDFVIFTGGTSAAMKILRSRPSLHITAETGGKNATIVTAMADRDQAVKNILHSAFSNTGQKCSATSLLILEEELYDDETFKQTLIDAAKSMSVGSAWEFHNRIGPLVRIPEDNLEHAIGTLVPGEEWALIPHMTPENPYILYPSIKWGIEAGSFCHTHELFGPVLAVMKAKDLYEAIEIVNDTGYGLTSGLESLDEREHAIWKERIKAGNLYINRPTTGAIVLRQPFGGMGKSAIGAGIKAGGWNYVTQFMKFEENGCYYSGERAEHPLVTAMESLELEGPVSQKIAAALQSYLYHYATHFSQEKEYISVRGEENTVRYLPLESLLIRVDSEDSLFDMLAPLLGAKVAGLDVIISLPEKENEAIEIFRSAFQALRDEDDIIVTQNDEEVAAMIEKVDAIRYADPSRVPPVVSGQSARVGKCVRANPPLSEGRLELLNYFREQSISMRYHRYGNLGRRGMH